MRDTLSAGSTAHAGPTRSLESVPIDGAPRRRSGEVAQLRHILVLSSVRAASEGLASGLQLLLPRDLFAHGSVFDVPLVAQPADRTSTLVFDGSAPRELQRLREASLAAGATRVVVFGLRDAADDLRCCARHQVRGLVAREATMSELASAIDTVSRGHSYTSASLLPRLLQLAAATAPLDDSHLERLTEREREIAALLARGLTYAQIAAEIAVSPSTVKNHVHNIYRKGGNARADVRVANAALGGPADRTPT